MKEQKIIKVKMLSTNKIMQKFVSFLIVFTMLAPAFLLPFVPHQAKAQDASVPVADWASRKLLGTVSTTSGTTATKQTLSWAQKLLEQTLKILAKKLLADMTQATVNWINSGFHGSPLFLENPESFFKDIAKWQVKQFVDMIGYDDFRFPFGKQTALNVIASYKNQFGINAQHTLSKVINDPDLFIQYQDFNRSGWDGFLINTQYPQNNYLGFNMMVQESLGSQLTGTLQAPAEKVRDVLQQGMGFLSPQTCPSNPSYNNGANEFLKPSYKSPPYTGTTAADSLAWEKKNNEDRAEWAKKNTCPGGLVSTTPGSVAANQVMTALNVPMDSATLAGALGNSLQDSISAIFDALINKLFETGLNTLSSTISSTPSVDNWRYEGQPLDTSYNPPSGTFSNALNVNSSVHTVLLTDATPTTTRTIAGGAGSYSIQTSTLDTSIAEVSFVNNASSPSFTVRSKGKGGETSFAIRDGSTPAKVATVNIIASSPGRLLAFPQNPTLNVNDTVVVTLYGGNGQYAIRSNSNQVVARADLAGNTLIVSGMTLGNTTITVVDSSSTINSINISIKVEDPLALAVSQESIFIHPGATRTDINTSINGRKNITMTNSGVVSVVSDDLSTFLRITGQATGSTTVTVTGPNHSTQNPQIAQFSITVADPLKATTSWIGLGDSWYQATMSGGTPPYIVTTPSGPGYVIAEKTNGDSVVKIRSYGNSSAVTSLRQQNTTSVEIEIADSSSYRQTIKIPFNLP